MRIPLAKLCSAVCGFTAGLVVGLLFFSQYFVITPKNIWKDAFKLIHNDRELEFQTSGNFEWWTGLNWNMTIKAKLPCTHGEEMIDELSQDNEEKSFKLLDQIHSAILLRQRERIIGSEHPLGHLLRFENSDVLFSEEIDFKKLRKGMEREGTNTLVANGPVNISMGEGFMLKLKVSQGKLKLEGTDEDEYFKLFRRVDKNNTTSLPEQIDGSSVEPEYDDPEKLYWLFDSDTARAQVNSSQIDFLKSQLKTGVFMSLKVIGSESSDNQFGYTLKTLSGSLENCTYKFSSNLHIDSLLDQTNDNTKPMVIRIPRRNAENEKLNNDWYNLIPYFRSFFSSPPPPPRNAHFCLTYERGIRNNACLLNTIVSFLICY